MTQTTMGYFNKCFFAVRKINIKEIVTFDLDKSCLYIETVLQEKNMN